MNTVARRQIAIWLFICSAMVFSTVVVGGVTRLTHSGLSIVEWQPLVGIVPPLTQADWFEVFEKYKLTPEYRQVNHSMSLDEFKGIFWWEYAHRVLGRTIGMVFFLGCALVDYHDLRHASWGIYAVGLVLLVRPGGAGPSPNHSSREGHPPPSQSAP